MGCSYDPVPYDIIPPPEDVWMQENKFHEHGSGAFRDSSSCDECGIIILGSKRNTTRLKDHLTWCPKGAREEVPLKTPEECKAFTYQSWH